MVTGKGLEEMLQCIFAKVVSSFTMGTQCPLQVIDSVSETASHNTCFPEPFNPIFYHLSWQFREYQHLDGVCYDLILVVSLETRSGSDSPEVLFV